MAYITKVTETLVIDNKDKKSLFNHKQFCRAHRLSERIARFLQKKMSNSLKKRAIRSRKEQFAQKNEQFAHLLIFGERPEGFACGRSFLVSDLSETLIF